MPGTNWQPGTWGKGNMSDWGVEHWNVNEDGEPHHAEMYGGAVPSRRFDIEPDGKLHPIVDALDQRWDDQDIQEALASHPLFTWGEPTHDGYGHANKLLGKTTNILDPIHAELDARVWDDPGAEKPVLKPVHHYWIKREIYDTLKKSGYTDIEDWLELVLTGSLTTYQYSNDSDVDISLFVDAVKFPEWSRAEMIGLMVGSLDGRLLPGTPFPLQDFVVGEGVKPHDLYKPGLRSGYSLDTGKWIVPPERERAHDVEAEENGFYAYALQMADKMERLLRYEPHKAVTFWHQIHKKRRRDQMAGKGDYAESNVVYKFLANRGLFPKISEASGEYIAKVAELAPWFQRERDRHFPSLDHYDQHKRELAEAPMAYYHVAPITERNRIMQHGLQPALPAGEEKWEHITGDPRSKIEGEPRGVYVYHTNDPWQAGQSHGSTQEDMDVWRIPDEQIKEIHDDPESKQFGEGFLTPSWDRKTKRYVIPHAVQPELVNHLRADEPNYPERERDQHQEEHFWRRRYPEEYNELPFMERERMRAKEGVPDDWEPRMAGTNDRWIEEEAYKLIAQNPGIRLPQIAEKLGVMQNNLYRLLPKMEEETNLVRPSTDPKGWYTLEQAWGDAYPPQELPRKEPQMKAVEVHGEGYQQPQDIEGWVKGYPWGEEMEPKYGKTSARVIYDKFRPDPVHPDEPGDEPTLPFIYNPATEIVHLGPAGAWHWQIVKRNPELQANYENEWNQPAYLENTGDHIHGAMHWPSKQLKFLGDSDPESQAKIADALGAPLPKYQWDFNSRTAHDELSQHVAEATLKDGGISVNLAGEEPTTGFAYAPRLETQQRIPIDQFTPDDVTHFIEEHRGALQEPGKYIGTWTQDGEVFMDVSEVHPDEDVAHQRAWEGHQKSMWDIDKGEEVPVRGVDYAQPSF